jgi:hypothetical protein
MAVKANIIKWNGQFLNWVIPASSKNPLIITILALF